MSIKIRDVRRAFTKLDMKIREGADTLAFFEYGGEDVLFTKVPHGSGDLKGKLPHYVRQQLKLNESDFKALLDCPIDRDKYIEILKQKGEIA